MESAVRRYRVMSYVVGVMLIVLVFVAVPIRYIGGEPAVSAVVSPTHGILYMVYLAAAFDLWRKAGWPPNKMLLMVGSGLLPFLAFFVERKITHAAHELPRPVEA